MAIQVQLPLVVIEYVFAFQIWHCELCVKKKNNEGEAESIIFIFVCSRFLSVKSFLKIWTNDFFLLTFEKVKPSLPLFLTIEGKRVIRLVFLSVSTIWTVKYCSKNLHFQSLIFFSLFVIFYSLSSRLLPARPLCFIVPHNGVKSIHVRKAWIVTCIGTENSDISKEYNVQN